jgi:hypothetical protein
MKSGLVAFVVSLLVTAGVLLGVRMVAAGRLQETSAVLRQLAGESIETTIRVKQTMELHAQIEIVEPTDIDLTLGIRDRVPVKMNVKVDEKLTVPIDIDINEMIEVESAAMTASTTKVRAKAEIDFDQPIKWKVASPVSPLINIKGKVPIDHEMDITFPSSLRVTGKIPVRFPLKKELIVPVSLDIPVDHMMDLNLEIKQQALVGFPKPLKITSQIPVAIDIPVKIPLRETPIAGALEKVAASLEGLLVL